MLKGEVLQELHEERTDYEDVVKDEDVDDHHQFQQLDRRQVPIDGFGIKLRVPQMLLQLWDLQVIYQGQTQLIMLHHFEE